MSCLTLSYLSWFLPVSPPPLNSSQPPPPTNRSHQEEAWVEWQAALGAVGAWCVSAADQGGL